MIDFCVKYIKLVKQLKLRLKRKLISLNENFTITDSSRGQD